MAEKNKKIPEDKIVTTLVLMGYQKYFPLREWLGKVILQPHRAPQG